MCVLNVRVCEVCVRGVCLSGVWYVLWVWIRVCVCVHSECIAREG